METPITIISNKQNNGTIASNAGLETLRLSVKFSFLHSLQNMLMIVYRMKIQKKNIR